MFGSYSNWTTYHRRLFIICLSLLDVDTACGFLKDISITPTCDIASKMVIVITLLSVQCLWLVFLFRERP
jgi:hypothetical protein